MSENSVQWTAAKMPDQTGRVVVITGANSGIGYEMARAFARKNAHVVVAGRNPQKCEQAAMNIRGESPDCGLEVIPLDLADLASVHHFADTFNQRHARLDILINNAGIMAVPQGQTKDGFELQFGTNHLGHFALTGVLIDRLLTTPGSRVVTISSGLHRTGKIDFDNLSAERSYNKWGAYGNSKLANLLFTQELQVRLWAAHSDAIAVAAHPGLSATNLVNDTGLFAGPTKVFNRIFAQSAAMGALPALYAAVAPDVVGGEYYGPAGFMEMRGPAVKVGCSDAAQDMAVAHRLWEVSVKQTGIDYAALPAPKN